MLNKLNTQYRNIRISLYLYTSKSNTSIPPPLSYLEYKKFSEVHSPCIVDENIIGAPKMRNNISAPQFAHFSLYSSFSYCTANFATAKVVTLNPFASFFVSVLYIRSWSLFLYCFPYIYRSFSLSKAIAKSIERSITLECAIKKRSKELIPKMKQRRLRGITLLGTIEKSAILLSQ